MVVPKPTDRCRVLYDSANKMQEVAKPIIARNLKSMNPTRMIFCRKIKMAT